MALALTVSFDPQAVDFDLRAGLPAGVARRIAAAVSELAPAGSGVVLDLGAGTGQIGRHLAGMPGARGRSRYLGLDVSGPMLAVFRRKLGAGGLTGSGGARGGLARADAAVGWPIASGRVDLVFLSRAAHLMPLGVLVEETLRVASREGALAVFGGVRSRPESLRVVLRREMRRLLAEQGIEGRSAGEAQRRIAGALAARGGEVLPVRTAASWGVVERAGDVLAAWRAKPGLGGRPVTPEVQDGVLRRLEDWVRERYGSLDVTRDAIECYDLAAVRLPKRTGEDLGANG
jgi:SAM-dependent methyltransferase